MEEDRNAHPTTEDHEGRQILLTPSQKDDGGWICQYTLLEFGPTRHVSVTGYPNGSCSTRDEAEAAVLEVAQGEIDSDVPKSSLD